MTSTHHESFRRRAARLSAAAIVIGLPLAGFASSTATALDEAALRHRLAERMPGMPVVDEIRSTAVPGLYELRIDKQVLYSDSTGDHLIQGAIFDTRTKVDITKARVDKLMAIDFSTLPLKDAIALQHGDGSRKLAVFADPNCGYCKHLEQELAKVKDVTVYVFPMPMLGEDSVARARDIWCTTDAAVRWQEWMLHGVAPAPAAMACDASALERNLAFAKAHHIQGTPALVFEDGSRNAGTLAADAINVRLQAARGRS